MRQCTMFRRPNATRLIRFARPFIVSVGRC
jgi:hypothetical protein